MNAVAENTLHPLQIEDARDAAHRASELQRGVEDVIRNASRDLAEKERLYREALSVRIVELKAAETAWTVCGDVARGEKRVAKLRYERDVAEGVLDAARQQGFRYGADRRDLHALVEWSRARDLRTDTPPAGWDRETGEIRERPRAVA